MEKNQIENDKKPVKGSVLKFVFLLVGALLIVFVLFIPSIVKSYVVRSLGELGLPNPRMTIRHVGSRQIDIQELTLGRGETPDLIIPSLAVDYSLVRLLKGRIEKVEITGMKLNVTAGKGGVTVKGLEALFQNKKGGKLILPVHQVHIASSMASIDWNGRKTIVPFELQVMADDSGEKVVFSADLNPDGDTFTIKGTLNTGSGDGTMRLSVRQADAGKYLDDFNVAVFQWFKSRVQLNAEINMSAWRISANRVSLVTRAFSAGFPGGTMTGALQLDCRLNREFKPEEIRLKLRCTFVGQTDFQIEIPFDLAVTGGRLDILKFKLDDLKFQRPPGIALQNVLGTASIQGDQLKIQGSYGCRVDAPFFDWLFPASGMKGQLAVTGTVQIAAGGQGTAWNLKGTGHGNLALALKHAQAKAAGLTFSFDSSGTEGHLRNSLDMELKGVEGRVGDLFFSAGNIRSRNTMGKIGGKNWSAGGRLKISDAAVRKSDGFAAEGLLIEAPWSYPFAAGIDGKKEMSARANPGNWRIDSVKIGDLNLGKATGEVKQREQGIELVGEVRTPADPVRIMLAGTCQWRDEGIDASLRVEVPETKIAKNSSLKAVHPALADYRCSGYISALGTISRISGEWKSRAEMKIRDWEMAGSSSGINCRGMNMTVNFKDLLDIRSEFSQRLDFKHLNISGLQLNQGDLLFEIDGTESLYVEGGEFAFSGGRILLQPFRYNFQGKGPTITLYSDRINFAEMVNAMLGEKIASGDAELNGLLTVDIVDGIPVFRDGYLYSTPGMNGNIKFTRSEAISGGVLIVEEAVKDFNYDWIKVKLDTAKEKLNMTATINGVPARKLPLTYDAKHKEIVRDPSGRRNLELKGLLLELRFTDIDLKSLMKDGAKIYFQEKKVP